MNCQKCNVQNEETAKFCKNCGKELQKTQQVVKQESNSKVTTLSICLIVAIVGCIILGVLLHNNQVDLRGTRAELIAVKQQPSESSKINFPPVTHFVKTNKAYLYDNPKIESKSEGLYLSKGQEVKVYKNDNDFSYVELDLGCWKIFGWVKSTDINYFLALGYIKGNEEDNVPFYKEPTPHSTRCAWIKGGSKVFWSKKENGYAYVEYKSKEGSDIRILGWIKESDINKTVWTD